MTIIFQARRHKTHATCFTRFHSSLAKNMLAFLCAFYSKFFQRCMLSLGIYQLELSASRYELLLYYTNIKMLKWFLTTSISLLLNHRERERKPRSFTGSPNDNFKVALLFFLALLTPLTESYLCIFVVQPLPWTPTVLLLQWKLPTKAILYLISRSTYATNFHMLPAKRLKATPSFSVRAY